MSKRQYNKAFINRDNLVTMLTHMLTLQDRENFKNPRLNENIWKLSNLLHELQVDTKGRYISEFENIEGGKNKQFPDLKERYIHISHNDPSSLKHEIKEILLAGTDTVEVDISNTVVYLFAKYISHDVDMLKEYERGDFYSLFPTTVKSRDEQKKLTQIWLQGWYDNTTQYNKRFPITGEFLKQTALQKDGLYKRNSGLFRDKEVELLNAIMDDVQLLFHLHDGFYIQKRNVNKVINSIKKHYGEEVRYKIHDFNKDAFSNEDICKIVDNIKWKSKDTTPIPETTRGEFTFYVDRFKGPIYRYKDTKEEVGAYITQQRFCESLYDIVRNDKLQGVKTAPVYIMQYGL